MALSDSCFEFLEEFGRSAAKLSKAAHRYSVEPFDYGVEIDAIRRLARTVAKHPYDTGAGARLLELASVAQRLHDTPPEAPELVAREQKLRELVRLLQDGLTGEDRSSVQDIVRNVASETPYTEKAAKRLAELLPKLGKTSYDLAVKVIGDVAAAAAKKWMGF